MGYDVLRQWHAYVALCHRQPVRMASCATWAVLSPKSVHFGGKPLGEYALATYQVGGRMRFMPVDEAPSMLLGGEAIRRVEAARDALRRGEEVTGSVAYDDSLDILPCEVSVADHPLVDGSLDGWTLLYRLGGASLLLLGGWLLVATNIVIWKCRLVWGPLLVISVVHTASLGWIGLGIPLAVWGTLLVLPIGVFVVAAYARWCARARRMPGR